MMLISEETPKFIYALQHKITGRIYVGSSFKVQERVYNHFTELKAGRHTNELMQSDVDEYGCEFDVFILDEISSIKESGKEHLWMDKLNTGDKRVGYNYKDSHFRNRKKPIPIKEGVPTPNKVESDE